MNHIRDNRTAQKLAPILGLVILALSAAGCGQASAASPQGSATVKISSPGMATTVTYRPNPVVALKPFHVTVSLLSANGKPVNNAHIVMHLQMTVMDMPEQTFALQSAGGGRYRGHSIFLMAGTWDMIAQIDVAGHKTKETVAVNVSD